ncbi:MAG: hypothetical protein NTV43_07660 [Methylococcales bacterium]|nr:hypothetical protein [Methylococcales bacterium]
MNIIDLRNNRQNPSQNERTGDRRKVPYEFGSPEWLAYVKNNGVDYPVYDRRKGDRRKADRELQDRRQNRAEPIDAGEEYVRILLTPAERTLIEDLYLIDLE